MGHRASTREGVVAYFQWMGLSICIKTPTQQQALFDQNIIDSNIALIIHDMYDKLGIMNQTKRF